MSRTTSALVVAGLVAVTLAAGGCAVRSGVAVNPRFTSVCAPEFAQKTSERFRESGNYLFVVTDYHVVTPYTERGSTSARTFSMAERRCLEDIAARNNVEAMYVERNGNGYFIMKRPGTSIKIH